jgi:uncharacterized OB-fold protein
MHGVTATSTDAEPTRRPLPVPTPETAHFWAGTAEHRLLLQRCDDCAGAYFPPRPFCPACGSRRVSVFEASGRATLHSYVINQRPGPGFDGPFAIAVVELDEGPRLMTNLVDVDQTEAALPLDMALEVTYLDCCDPNGENPVTLPLFRPSTAAAGAEQ